MEKDEMINQYIDAITDALQEKYALKGNKKMSQILQERDFYSVAFQSTFLSRLQETVRQIKIRKPGALRQLNQFYKNAYMIKAVSSKDSVFIEFLEKKTEENYAKWKKSCTIIFCCVAALFIAIQGICFVFVQKDVLLFGSTPTEKQVRQELYNQYHVKTTKIKTMHHERYVGVEPGEGNVEYTFKYNDGEIIVEMCGIYMTEMQRMSDMRFNCKKALLNAYMEKYMGDYYLASNDNYGVSNKFYEKVIYDDDWNFEEELLIRGEADKAKCMEQFRELVNKIYENDVLSTKKNQYRFNIYVGKSAKSIEAGGITTPSLIVDITEKNYEEELEQFQEQLEKIIIH